MRAHVERVKMRGSVGRVKSGREREEFKFKLTNVRAVRAVSGKSEREVERRGLK